MSRPTWHVSLNVDCTGLLAPIPPRDASTSGIPKTMGRSLDAVTSALQEVLIVARILSYR